MERYAHYAELGRWTRAMMRKAGLELLAAEKDAAPTIATFPLSAGFHRNVCGLDFGLRTRATICGHADGDRLQRWEI